MGNSRCMESTVHVADVRTFQTKSGNTRYVLRDDSGKEYTTFREEIGRAALSAQGRDARIEYHEEQRGGFQNVYLDAVEPAPWLLGSTPPEGEVPAEELFDKLQPFKELVAEDIRDGEDED